MKSLLFDVDTQFDFMDHRGKLYIPGAETIIPPLRNVFSLAVDNGMKIISTMDWHDPDDEEFKTFPPHCVIGESGIDKIQVTDVYSDYYQLNMPPKSNAGPLDVELHQQFIALKKTYDVWHPEKGCPNAIEGILAAYKPARIFIVGVASDICVLAAVKGLVKYRPRVYVITDAIKGLKDEAQALAQMEDMGAWLVKSDEMEALV